MMVVIVGPTASGKSDLAFSLAKKFNAEIVCADSRTIYRDMNIGTAKPTPLEQNLIPHHMIDLISPGEVMSAALFKSLANQVIEAVRERGSLPMLVGGSGLYVDSILYDFKFPPEADIKMRKYLQEMDDTSLQNLLISKDPAAGQKTDFGNRRRVIRAIETIGNKGSRSKVVIPDTLVIGLALSKEVAQMRIQKRVVKMLSEGFISEVNYIGETYGWDSPALDVIGYRAFKDVALGAKTIEQGTQDFISGDLALYKKQVTWFKRNKSIHWINADKTDFVSSKAESLVAGFLNDLRF
jgi:tRNA dimethylallyltransferase